MVKVLHQGQDLDYGPTPPVKYQPLFIQLGLLEHDFPHDTPWLKTQAHQIYISFLFYNTVPT